ncbi:hypothetical protein AYL99_10474 [Fonsecaea erecta]|uniref:Uncharacterized protein n=1 Tax=Fonsecaea erecta TaxID=1367422 RepID=A0A178Z7N2_9EURO|nr:hypothetical protein AYL99_10474 [Fonsecaea erecta]OAP55501.1 hypothetical protein AYL99_10474 [Fonsecaea erecta]
MYIALEKRGFSTSNAGFNLSTTGIISICIILVLFITVTSLLCMTNARKRRLQRLKRLQRKQNALRTTENRPAREPLRFNQSRNWNTQRPASTQVKRPAPAHVVGECHDPLEPPPAYQA